MPREPSRHPDSVVLRSLLHVQRRGTTAVLQQLEQANPELAEYVMKSLTQVRRSLLNLGGPAKPTQALHHQIEVAMLTAIQSLQLPPSR